MHLHGEMLELRLQPGEAAWLRRSSLVRASGPFVMRTARIAARRVSVFAVFTGEVRWANRFEAASGPVCLSATRDFHGTVVELPVSPDRPLRLKPALYLGHRGEMKFTMRRSAKREFWVLTEAIGTGSVIVKLPGKPRLHPLLPEGEIVDTNYVAAVSGTFEANGKVFNTGELVKSGELENVRLSGEGHYLLCSENPGDAGASEGGGGLVGSLFNLLPF